jgi:NADP-dependent aldehyde dehydrogenase
MLLTLGGLPSYKGGCTGKSFTRIALALLNMARLVGRSIIGFRDGGETSEHFYAIDPANGQRLQPAFSPATSRDVERAAQLAGEAFAVYGRTSGQARGAFLRTIAANIESITDKLIERARQETALPKPRLEGETARTCGQLRLFAQVVEEGSWVGARIDRADPDRRPTPKPAIRSMLRPLGPVAVFGAANFPLAFSVAGGDTASALAAGNPVIVKAHPAHPGTSELVGQSIRTSVRECGLHEGVFSLLFDRGTQVGRALVTHPILKAVGFTGSRSAGRALMDLAASRPEPIPFFAEMSSTNPVFILPGALRERGESVANGLHTSFTLGAGQFCTKPGMVFVPQGAEGQAFTQMLQKLVAGSVDYYLLTSGIRSSYLSAVAGRKEHAVSTSVTEGTTATPGAGYSVGAVLFETDAASFLKRPELEAEIFGPTTLLVQHSSHEEVLEMARRLGGHLTASVHGTEKDLRDYADLIAILENKVGRLIFNGFPTGVEVSHAMVHGGPYPATSDGRFTSVGSPAIFRFARPVCYQGFPDGALPEELTDANPLGIWRMIDGQMTRGTKAPAGKQTVGST